jgi:hypothetical protein
VCVLARECCECLPVPRLIAFPIRRSYQNGVLDGIEGAVDEGRAMSQRCKGKKTGRTPEPHNPNFGPPTFRRTAITMRTSPSFHAKNTGRPDRITLSRRTMIRSIRWDPGVIRALLLNICTHPYGSERTDVDSISTNILQQLRNNSL